ncbi:hypothetical protein [Streptomyces rhizosphaericus]|uniref:hypothetical protein n=1 Tax=Streptomyces rhizosphaericus TaxID=114699 RepID=UPI00117E55E4|nr:hypothetical protein [Streptomyces rhizosphaericus]
MSDEVKAREEELIQLLTATRLALEEGNGTPKVHRLRNQAEQAFAQWRIATSVAAHQETVRSKELRAQPGTLREKAHAALLILKAPAHPSVLCRVYEAFHRDTLLIRQVSRLRREEPLLYQSSDRPFFVCSVLGPDLQPARALYASSTWPLERRVVTEPGLKLWELEGIAHVADAVQAGIDAGEGSPEALQLLREMARSAGMDFARTMSPERIGAQARLRMPALLARHQNQCTEFVARASDLEPSEQLFGIPLVRLTADQKAARLLKMARDADARVATVDVPASSQSTTEPESGTTRAALPPPSAEPHTPDASPEPGRTTGR